MAVLCFPPQVLVLSPIHRNGKPLESSAFECTLDHITPTKYDEMAIRSYRAFCKPRDQGNIPQGVRFQVSILTPINTTWSHIDYANCERVEPLYMERFTQDLRRLQRAIRAQDLAIQIDAAIEFPYLEYTRGNPSSNHNFPRSRRVFSNASPKFPHLSTKMCSSARSPSTLRRSSASHFVQPEDAGLLIEIALGISERGSP